MAKLTPETAGNSGAKLGRKLGFFTVNLAVSTVSVVAGVALGLAQGTGKVAKDAWDSTEDGRSRLKERLDEMALEADEQAALQASRKQAEAQRQLAAARAALAQAEAAVQSASARPAEQVKLSKTANGRRQVATVIEGEGVPQPS